MAARSGAPPEKETARAALAGAAEPTRQNTIALNITATEAGRQPYPEDVLLEKLLSEIANGQHAQLVERLRRRPTPRKVRGAIAMFAPRGQR